MAVPTETLKVLAISRDSHRTPRRIGVRATVQDAGLIDHDPVRLREVEGADGLLLDDQLVADRRESRNHIFANSVVDLHGRRLCVKGIKLATGLLMFTL